MREWFGSYSDYVDIAMNCIFSYVCNRLIVLARSMGQPAMATWVDGPGYPRTTWQFILVPLLLWSFSQELIKANSINAWVTSIKFLTFTLLSSTCFTFILLHRFHRLNSRFGRTWVKSLDFAYLGLGSFALIRLITSLPKSDTHALAFDEIAIVTFCLALAIRLTKATMEVFFDSWIK